MNKLIRSVSLLAFLALGSFAFAGGEQKAEAKSCCAADKAACCKAEAKSDSACCKGEKKESSEKKTEKK